MRKIRMIMILCLMISAALTFTACGNKEEVTEETAKAQDETAEETEYSIPFLRNKTGMAISSLQIFSGDEVVYDAELENPVPTDETIDIPFEGTEEYYIMKLVLEDGSEITTKDININDMVDCAIITENGKTVLVYLLEDGTEGVMHLTIQNASE